MAEFKVQSDYEPSGDQPTAIKELVAGLKHGDKHQTLLGVTGSGKTFTIAKVIEEVQRPTLIISHNKTLAAQLFGEFKTLFPNKFFWFTFKELRVSLIHFKYLMIIIMERD